MNQKFVDSEEQLEIKKRARRRLVGAVVFVSIAAVILPVVMDEEPPRSGSDVELFIPKRETVYSPPSASVDVVAAIPKTPEIVSHAPEPVVESPKEREVVPKRTNGNKTSTSSRKVTAASEARGSDAQRAKAILEGKDEAGDANRSHVVLIGAFANPGNVKVIQQKLNDMGIKVYTELLRSPQGNKTRVRAGPFETRKAAEDAATRMKKIGINGVVAAKS